MLSNPKISFQKWWGMVKSIYGTKVCSTIPPLKENDIYVYDPKEKAKLLNDYFVSQATQHSYILSAHTRESFRAIANGVL
jgi:hypothetical protein